jgi:hypothetical protein
MKTFIKTFSGRNADNDAAVWVDSLRAKGLTAHPPSLAIDSQNGKHITVMMTAE